MQCDIYKWEGHDEKRPRLSLKKDEVYLVVRRLSKNLIAVSDENQTLQLVILPVEAREIKDV